MLPIQRTDRERKTNPWAVDILKREKFCSIPGSRNRTLPSLFCVHKILYSTFFSAPREVAPGIYKTTSKFKLIACPDLLFMSRTLTDQRRSTGVIEWINYLPLVLTWNTRTCPSWPGKTSTIRPRCQWPRETFWSQRARTLHLSDSPSPLSISFRC